MAHLDIVPAASSAEISPILGAVEAAMGFAPNSMRTMAHRPVVLSVLAGFAGTVLGTSTVPAESRQLVASRFHKRRVAGTARHTLTTARRGVADEKLAVIRHFETSLQHTPPERAAPQVAYGAGEVPSSLASAGWTVGKHG